MITTVRIGDLRRPNGWGSDRCTCMYVVVDAIRTPMYAYYHVTYVCSCHLGHEVRYMNREYAERCELLSRCPDRGDVA